MPLKPPKQPDRVEIMIPSPVALAIIKLAGVLVILASTALGYGDQIRGLVQHVLK